MCFLRCDTIIWYQRITTCMAYDEIVVRCQRHTHMPREGERAAALRWLHKLLNNWCILKRKCSRGSENEAEGRDETFARWYMLPLLLPYFVIVMKMASAFCAFVIPSRRFLFLASSRRLRCCSFHFLLLDDVNVSIFFSLFVRLRLTTHKVR